MIKTWVGRIWVGREESVEYALLERFNMLLLLDENGKAMHEYFEVDINGSQFELMHVIEGNTRPVKYKLVEKVPAWVEKFILNKTMEDKNFFIKHFITIKIPESKSGMVNERVVFKYYSKNIEGVVKDRLACDDYLIADDEGKLYIINPINLENIIKT